MLLRCCLNDFEMLPVAHVACVFTFYMRWTCIVRSIYFRIFTASTLITFLSPEIATSINIHIPLSVSWIRMSSLLLGIVLSVYYY